MKNLDKLMFRREHFPLDKKHMIFSTIFPPYHPSLVGGLDPRIVVAVLEEGVSDYIMDLDGINDKWKESVKVCPKFEVHEGLEGLVIKPFPTTWGTLFIDSNGMRMSSQYGSDHRMILDLERKDDIIISGDISEELQKEYELEMMGKTLDGKNKFFSNHLWKYHNVHPLDRVLYKNIIIALNNEIVRRKYREA